MSAGTTATTSAAAPETSHAPGSCNCSASSPEAVPPYSVRCGVCCGTIRDPVSLSCGHANLCRAPCAKLLVERAASLAKLVALTSDPGATPPTFLMKGKTVFEEVGSREADSAASGTNCLYVECPVCSGKTRVPVDQGVNALQTDAEMQASVESYLENEKMSSVCEICEEKPAEYRCTCGVLVCKNSKCTAATKKMHAKAADHPLVLNRLSEIGISQIQRCIEHGKPYEFWCTKDQVPVCYMCLRCPAHQDPQSGNSHPSVLLTEAVREMQEEVLTQATRIDGKATEIKASLDQIGAARLKLENTCEALRREVNRAFDELCKLIETRRKIVLDETGQLEKSSDILLAAQQDCFTMQHQLLSSASIKAKAIGRSSDPIDLCTNFVRIKPKLESVLNFKAVLEPCCSTEVYFSSNPQWAGEANTFGTLCFGVDLGKSRLSTTIQPTLPLVGMPVEVTITVSHLADLCGSPVPSILIVPSLQRLKTTISDSAQSFSPADTESIQVRNRRGTRDSDISAVINITWIPLRHGLHTIYIGTVSVGTVNVQDVDLRQTVILNAPACCNVGTPTTVKIQPKYISGEQVAEERLQVLSDLISMRYAVLSQQSEVMDDQWNPCQNVGSISIHVTLPGAHFLYVEGKHKFPSQQQHKWTPICGSPIQFLATQVDISKCRINNVPSLAVLNEALKLQIQLFDQNGNEVDKNRVLQGGIKWKTTVEAAPGKGPQGQMIVSEDYTEHIVTLKPVTCGWCKVTVEGTIDGSTFQAVSGSPFTLLSGMQAISVVWDRCSTTTTTISNQGSTFDGIQGPVVAISSQEITVPTYYEVKVERRVCCGWFGLIDMVTGQGDPSSVRVNTSTGFSFHTTSASGRLLQNRDEVCGDFSAITDGSTVGVCVVPHDSNGSVRFFLNGEQVGTAINNVKTTGMVPAIDFDRGGRVTSAPAGKVPEALLNLFRL
ncbi:hypothetical protein Pelo_16950 [Pelomyxa schiedti]|nr:hypothetical protein Pelo_16950 [Pelomyxa schiedti]